MYTLSIKQPAYSILTRTQVFCSWKPGAANTLLGQRIDRFQFTELLQETPHNSIFRGQDVESNIPVVIKLFSSERSQDQVYAHAFKSGMMAAKGVHDPSFVQIFDAGMSTKEQLYVVMADVPGKSLHDWIYRDTSPPSLSSNFAEALQQQKALARQREPTNGVFALRFAEQIANHLATLARIDLLHPHLSPTKCLIQEDGSVVILGLGVPVPLVPDVSSKQGGFYPLSYTAVDEPLSFRSHMFTLGVILYEMLVGSRPLRKEKRRKHAFTTSSEIMPLEHICLGLTDETYALVAKCLHRSAWSRYETVADLQDAIGTALRLETAVAQPYLEPEPVQDSPVPVVATAVPEPITPKPTPKVKPVKPIRRRRATQPPQPMPKTVAKAAVLPKVEPQAQPITIAPTDNKEEKRGRSKRLFILPAVVLLLFLLAGGAFVFNQNSSVPEATPVAAPLAAPEGIAETAVAPAISNTPNAPVLQFLSPIDNGEYAQIEEITFQIRWSQPLSAGEQLFIKIQKNSWGKGTIIGAVAEESGEEGVYKLTVPVNEIAQLEGTYWWQLLLDSDGDGPNLGVALSELRPFNILAPVITTTRRTATPIPTVTAKSTTIPTIIACIRQPDWIEYAIQAGDTLSELAKNSGTTVPQILVANCLNELPVLIINSNILLPRPLNTPIPTVLFVPTNTAVPVPTNNPTSPPAATPIPPTATAPPVAPSSTPPPVPTTVPTTIPIPPTSRPPTATTEPPTPSVSSRMK